MKVIIDVQKLYDEMETFYRDHSESDLKIFDHELFGEHIEQSITDLLLKKVYPDWASKPTATNKAKLSGGYTAEFEAFWNNYPKKTGKGTAFLEWQKINKKEEILEMVLNALVWQKIAWAKNNNKYVPMPENYLKGRRWEDDAPAQTKVERYLTPDGVWKER